MFDEGGGMALGLKYRPLQAKKKVDLVRREKELSSKRQGKY